MRGRILVLAILLVSGISAPAFNSPKVSAARRDASFNNVHMYGSDGFEYIQGIQLDHAGAVLAYGTFEQAVDFNKGGTPDIKTPLDNDAFVTKRNADGSYAWTKTFGQLGSYDNFNSLAIDSQNNVYVTSVFTGTYDFNSGGAPDSKTSNGLTDIFVTKYSASGVYQWTKTIGGTGSDYASQIKFDALDNLYLTGNFQNTVDFNPGGVADSKVSNGQNDAYITKYNANGTYGWTKAYGGTSDDNGDSIFVASNGDIYVQTYYYGTLDFDPTGGVDSRTTKGQYDVGFTRYTSAGVYLWTKTYGTTGYDFLSNVALDSQDNIYFSGSFTGTNNFNNEGTADNKTSAGQTDAFITRFNSNGTYGWTTAYGDTNYDNAFYLTIDSQDNLYLTGSFTGTVDYNGAAPGGVLTSQGSYDTYIAKFDTTGANVWLKSYGGTGYDTSSGLAIDAANNLYITGEFENDSITLTLNSGQQRQLVNDNTSTHYQAHSLVVMNSAGEFTGGTVMAFNNDYAFTENPIISADNKLFISGRVDYQDTITFDPHGQAITEVLPGDSDAFVLRYDLVDYNIVTGLATGLKLKSLSDSSVDVSTDGVISTPSIGLQLTTDTGLPLAAIPTNMTADRSWSTVTGATDAAAGKSFVHNLTTQPGAASSFSLYVPKLSGSKSVFVCPGAASLAAVSNSCAGGYTLSLSKSQITEATIGGKAYFVVPNLTGTGALSIDGTLADTGMNQTIIGGIAVTLLLGATYFIRARFKYSTL